MSKSGISPITQGQAAAMLGVGTRRVRQIVQDGGGPAQAADGSFPAEEFGKWFRQRVIAELGVTEDGHIFDFNAERGRLTKAQADRTELEVAELRGELVRVEDVTAAWGQHIASARSRLLAMPTRVAPRISPPGMVVQTEGLIRAIVEESLNELAGDGLPERTRSRISRAAGVEGPGEADGERVGGPAPSPEPRKQRRARKVGHREG